LYSSSDQVKFYDYIIGTFFFHIRHENYPSADHLRDKSFVEKLSKSMSGGISEGGKLDKLDELKKVNSNIQGDSTHDLTLSIRSLILDPQKKEASFQNISQSTLEHCLYESMTNPIHSHPLAHKKVIKLRHNKYERFFLSKYLYFKEKHYLESSLSAFSLQISISSLSMVKRNDRESEELEVLEGIRALSMFWGIFTATSLYVLVAHVQNIFEMLKLFESISFTMIASGNLSPDLFLFVGVFLGFVKINHLYDERKGISALTYAKLLLYRYAKYAPLYYFVFFVGWSIFPYLSNSDTWYLSETLFDQCDKYWWTQLLFIGNLYPWFVEGLNGCFYWPYIIV
jgi:hypothetical protein